MEQVRKTFFNPLATSKSEVIRILEDLPVGSSHPFSPEKLLLCRTESGIKEIDISEYPEDFFFNAVNLGEMSDVLLERMAKFDQLKVFEDFQITQAPDATFKIPIVSDQITILAVSDRKPTYWDFCFADESYNACCWSQRNTFPGITHSGDTLEGLHLLHYVRINETSLTEKEICVFISGYRMTQITRFLGTHPALMVADHVDKILYIIPVPLDAATIEDATICCPLVIKKDGSLLICSILPAATTDRGMMCSSNRLVSPSFPEAIRRADFTTTAHETTKRRESQHLQENQPSKKRKLTNLGSEDNFVEEYTTKNSANTCMIVSNEHAVFTTSSVVIPPFIDEKHTQIIRFGTGLEFNFANNQQFAKEQASQVVFPCIFGTQLEGPILLATGTSPSNTPFTDGDSLRNYYRQLKSAVVIVDEKMTDNARNLASNYRINALFIVQLTPEIAPKNLDDVCSLMNSANINAVTAHAGPQSLVLAQIADRFYFYRGIANRVYLKTSDLAFGSDVTSLLQTITLDSILDPRIERIIDLGGRNSIILPTSGQRVEPQDLQKVLDGISIEKVQSLEEDIFAAAPQLQSLLNQKDLQELSKNLVNELSAKISHATTPLREKLKRFLAYEYNMENSQSVMMKNKMVGELRKITKDMQKLLEPVISCLASMISSQTTSKRTHDLKRLVRQTTIQDNLEATKSMTFETLAGFLEDYAGDMGVMLTNIETTSYRALLGNLKANTMDASECCALDSRILHLEGFDAGIIIEQSQASHDGPLKSTIGSSQPILALPYLSQLSATGSMLAWVCWDEFVNLKSPYKVRWMEKCNEPHIAALRIIMRNTLSQAVASREYNFQSSSPETGNLMSTLLMAAMSKLGAMRTSKPIEMEGAEDTVTKLMRGLFGNLLTIAGSGVRPLSMVWQLFGLHPQFDVPSTPAEWVWYETVVALYPYTGWPLAQFHANLEKLLDRTLVRVVTKNENLQNIKASRREERIKYCKLRNIQLDHSRSIITVLMRMLTDARTSTTSDQNAAVDLPAIASRLLAYLPHTLENQSQSYTKMIAYLSHLADGGGRDPRKDNLAANVYTRRSAAFAQLKKKVHDSCQEMNWDKVIEYCEAIVAKQNEVATVWQVTSDKVRVQNIQPYKALLSMNLSDDVDEGTRTKRTGAIKKIIGDAEIKRVPWQVGKDGQYGVIQPLDESFVHEILKGERPNVSAPTRAKTEEKNEQRAAMINFGDQFAGFKGALRADFIQTMQKDHSPEEVCAIMGVPVSAMRVFVHALNPDFAWVNLAENFKFVILELVKERSGREESRPVRRLMRFGEGKLQLQE